MKSSITRAPQRPDPPRNSRGKHGDARVHPAFLGPPPAPAAPALGAGSLPRPPSPPRDAGPRRQPRRGKGWVRPEYKKAPPALTAIGGGRGRAPFCLLGFVLLVLLPHGGAAAGPAGSAGAGGPSRPPRRKIRVRGRPCLAQRALYEQRLPLWVPAASGLPALAIPVAPARRSRGRACLR